MNGISSRTEIYKSDFKKKPLLILIDLRIGWAQGLLISTPPPCTDTTQALLNLAWWKPGARHTRWEPLHQRVAASLLPSSNRNGPLVAKKKKDSIL